MTQSKRMMGSFFENKSDLVFYHVLVGKPIKPKPLPEGCKDAQCHLPCKDGFFKLSAVGYGLKCVRRCPIGYFTAFRFCIGTTSFDYDYLFLTCFSHYTDIGSLWVHIMLMQSTHQIIK